MPKIRFMNLRAFACAALCVSSFAFAASKDLGNGFADHGVCVPISNHRGTVTARDGQGHNVLLSLLSDHRGGYSVLMLDATDGKARQIPMPFTKAIEDYPYTCLLSSQNKFYTSFADHFVEFDPEQAKFTFWHKTTTQMGMGMTEDDAGVIWCVIYPQSAVVSFDPKTKAFKDYGNVYTQNWPQYQRFVAADDQGFIYFGLGNTASQIVAFDPKTGKATPMLAENERKKGIAYLYRDTDGKVYGQPLKGDDDNWYEFHKGVGKKIGKHETINPKVCLTGDQAFKKLDFPDGSRVKDYDLVGRKFVVEQKDKSVKEYTFDYTSEGAVVMGAATTPDNAISGGTAFPMRNFRYDPKTDELINRPAYGQWNTTTKQDTHFFAGGYPGGFLLDLDTAKPWVNTNAKDPASNPELIIKDCDPTIHRPHTLLAHPDGHTIIMGGTPEYGYTGGGLCFWDRTTRKRTLLTDQEIIPDQSTMNIIALEGGKLLAGTTTEPGTGGERKATEAQLYLMDFASKKLDWHEAILPGVQGYQDLKLLPDGKVLGIADKSIVFVFDPETRKIVHQENVEKTISKTASQQGSRIFVTGPDGSIYLLLNKGIALIDPKTYAIKLIAQSPISVDSGGDFLDGRIYFLNGSHLYSYQLPKN